MRLHFAAKEPGCASTSCRLCRPTSSCLSAVKARITLHVARAACRFCSSHFCGDCLPRRPKRTARPNPGNGACRWRRDQVVVNGRSSGKRPSWCSRTNLVVVDAAVGTRFFRPPQCRDRAVLPGIGCFGWNLGESMTAEAALALRQFALSTADPKNVYLLVVTVPPALGEIAGEQVAQIRLLPRDHRLRYRGRVRERLEPSPEATGLVSEGLPWRIARGARENDPQYKIARAKRELELADLRIWPEAAVCSRACSTRAAKRWPACTDQGRAKAAKAFSARRSPNCSGARVFRHGAKAYYGLLTTCIESHAAAGREQIQDLSGGFGEVPARRPIALRHGRLHAGRRFQLGSFGCRLTARRFEFGQIDPQTWHVPDIHEIAAICLSLTFQMRGNEEEGPAACWSKCSRGVPNRSASAVT